MPRISSLTLALLATCLPGLAADIVDIPGVVEDQPQRAPHRSPRERPTVTRETPPVPKLATPPPNREEQKREKSADQPEVQEIIPMPRGTDPRDDLHPMTPPDNAEAAPAPTGVKINLPEPTPRRHGPASMADTIATLDGEPIQRAELYDAMVDNYGRQVFQRLLNRRLLRSEMKRLQLTIPASEIDTTFRAHMQRLAKEARQKVDPVAYVRYRFGLTPEEYKARIVWVELALKRLVQKDLQVTEADLFNYYWSHRKDYTQPEELRLRHILISPYTYAPKGKTGAQAAGAAAWRRALETALAVQNKLRAGADFKQLARQYSHDKVSAARGGDLGFLPRGTMLKPVEDAALALEKGQASELVKTRLGYHLLLLEDRTPKRLQPFSEVKNKARKDYEAYLVLSHSSDLLNRLYRQAIQEGRLRIADPDLQPMR